MHNSKICVVEPKPVTDWNKEELHLNKLNCQWLHLLISSIITKESSLISRYTSSKEAWDFLERKYDGCFS